MSYPENIYLVGPMGAGKSTIGRQLAKQLRKEFVDCDHELEQRTGADIPLIFELEGEDGFRRREADMLSELSERRGIVLATGGGVVNLPENRSKLVTHGFVVYLRAPLELLYERTAKDRNRPLLRTDDPKQRIRELFEERDPLYQQVADLVVDTDRRGLRFVVRDIIKELPE
ncbi:MAG: shikimate kinase [Gammaproteobacteria bacterium]|jgi:shikimate kinase